MSIFVLIGGVVLLTYKKPDPAAASSSTTLGVPSRSARAKTSDEEDADERDLEALHTHGPGENSEVMWQIGDADDESDDGRGATGGSSLRPQVNRTRSGSGSLRARSNSYAAPKHEGEEGRGLMGGHDDDDDDDESPAHGQSSRTNDDDQDYGTWERTSVTGSPRARR